MKPLRVVFTGPAIEDLDRAMEHLFAKSPLAAIRLHDAVTETLELLALRTLHGRTVTLTTGESVERWVVAPCVLYVQREPDTLIVLHVHDGRRAPIER